MNWLGFQKAPSEATWKMDSRCETGAGRSGEEAIRFGEGP